MTSKTHSVYPSCATRAGSVWIAIQDSLATGDYGFLDDNHDNSADNSKDYRVDGRVWNNQYWIEGDLSSPMIRSEDMDARKLMEACLEAVNLWFHPLYHYYLKCNSDDQHTDFQECKPEQNEYEQMVCTWRTEENKLCDEYDACIAGAQAKCGAGAATCTQVGNKILARKADYETGQRIVCLLSVLIGKVGEEGGVGDQGNATNANYDKAEEFARKREYLESCKNKKTNDNPRVNRFYARKVISDSTLAVDSTIGVYSDTEADKVGDYTLVQEDMDILEECMTRVCGYHSLTTVAGATNIGGSLNHAVSNASVDDLDNTLAALNATRSTSAETTSTDTDAIDGKTVSTASCTIDTEQWEMLIPCGENPPRVPEYPYSFCKVVDSSVTACSRSLLFFSSCSSISRPSPLGARPPTFSSGPGSSCWAPLGCSPREASWGLLR